MKLKRSVTKLVYTTDPVEVVKLARAKGWSNEKIITKLMFGKVYEDRMAIAKTYAPVMGLELAEFIIIAGLRKVLR